MRSAQFMHACLIFHRRLAAVCKSTFQCVCWIMHPSCTILAPGCSTGLLHASCATYTPDSFSFGLLKAALAACTTSIECVLLHLPMLYIPWSRKRLCGVPFMHHTLPGYCSETCFQLCVCRESKCMWVGM
jgi:hypothetical protein